MVRTRRNDFSVEDSWRMVEGGDNDSFDTAVVQDPFEGDAIVFSSQSQDRSQPAPSQQTSFDSQDSIRDFYEGADEEDVILKAPFRPSFPPSRNVSMDKDQTPVPEFFMPNVDAANSPSRGTRRSTKSVQPVAKDAQLVRRRNNRQDKSNNAIQKQSQEKENEPPQRPSLWHRFTASAPEFLFEFASWTFGIIRMVFQIAQKPLAIMLAIYLLIGACMFARDMLVKSVTAPICQIPGVSLFNPSFCSDSVRSGSQDGSSVLEFDELMNAQAQFEKVLEDSAQGVSLPMDMKRSEASVRDLRTMVKFSELPTRGELVHEFDNYINVMRDSANSLQMFNTRVGSAVDSVISINRWTSRYIDSMAIAREANNNAMSRFNGWLFSPFQVSHFDERSLLVKYIEHTALVSDKIHYLTEEAIKILDMLYKGEASLELISEHVVTTGNAVKEEQNEVFWSVWTIVGANNRRLHNLKSQLSLLQQVEVQRQSAVRRLSGLILDLKDIETKISDLRDRVAAPELLGDQPIPLTVHIDTINAGVERLEGARSRIRAEENERLQQAMLRSREDDRLIDG
ncbi:hypothetical protein M426DRAFT_325774 [Hypoxylon sp. CI-4A]|nr:hypothetical protein M426DRAFT_325774 [Hypoxylon sp. CI-4A]